MSLQKVFLECTSANQRGSDEEIEIRLKKYQDFRDNFNEKIGNYFPVNRIIRYNELNGIEEKIVEPEFHVIDEFEQIELPFD